MICDKCGKFMDNKLKKCPFCGQPVGNKKGNDNTNLIILLIILSSILVVAIVAFTAVMMYTAKNQPYEVADVSYEQLQSESAVINEKPVTTFSGEIGKVNGVLYAGDHIGYTKGDNGYNTEKTEKSLIPVLPVEGYTNNGYSWIVSGFVHYDGYVYYMLSYPQSPMEESKLYRCKPDFSGQEFIGGSSYDLLEGKTVGEFSGAATDFVIHNDVLYFILPGYDLSGGYKVPSVDLKTMQIADRDFPDVKGYVYNDVVFEKESSGNGSYNLYVNNDGRKKKIGNELTFVWGYDGEFVYYSNPVGDGTHSNLYKANVNTGDEELVDCKSSAKDGTPYFCF